MPAQRIDPADGCAYSLADFTAAYGGSPTYPPKEWLTAAEARIDPADGNFYSLADFIEAYGGSGPGPHAH